MRQWLFDKAELAASPSRRAGMDAATEDRYRREGIRFILEAGKELSLKPNPTLATACVFFHRFYTVHSFREYHRFLSALAALFLAGKVEETPKKCRDLVEVALAKLSKTALAALAKEPNADLSSPAAVAHLREEVMSVERVLLQTLKFDLQVVHPYRFLLQYAKIFRAADQKKNEMVQMAWTFLNDSLATTLCLQWEPEVIAIALIYLSARLSKMDQRDFEGRSAGRKQWWDLYVSDMPTKLLEEICHMVLDLYSGDRSKPKSGSLSTSTSSTGPGGASRASSTSSSAPATPAPIPPYSQAGPFPAPTTPAPDQSGSIQVFYQYPPTAPAPPAFPPLPPFPPPTHNPAPVNAPPPPPGT